MKLVQNEPRYALSRVFAPFTSSRVTSALQVLKRIGQVIEEGVR